jgi:hypothetical protein
MGGLHKNIRNTLYSEDGLEYLPWLLIFKWILQLKKITLESLTNQILPWLYTRTYNA